MIDTWQSPKATVFPWELERREMRGWVVGEGGRRWWALVRLSQNHHKPKPCAGCSCEGEWKTKKVGKLVVGEIKGGGERETAETKVEIERQKEKADRERNRNRWKWPALPSTMEYLVYLSSMYLCSESCLFPEILWAGLCSRQKTQLKWMDRKELYF